MNGALVLAGGGTGGHVFPMIAVADAVRALAPGIDIVFVGTARGLEAKVVPERGYTLELLDATPMRGGGLGRALSGAVHAARSIPVARACLVRHGARAVFSIGGYAAGPVTVAARLLRIPVALLEPNSEIGFANRVVAPFVQRAYVAFAETGRHFSPHAVARTGVPLRRGFAPVPFRRGTALRVLVLGGSQGAASLNETVPEALAATRATVTVVHQAGAGRDAAVRALYTELGAGERARVVSFIEDMPRALADADLVIGRAGAGAVAEICAVGRPSILIPYPFAGDHQRHNAESLRRSGAAVTVLAKDATVARIAHEVERLASETGLLSRMAAAAQSLGRPDAADVIARDFLALAGLGGATIGNGASGSNGSSGNGASMPHQGISAGSRLGAAANTPKGAS